jgi:antitoxin YefM
MPSINATQARAELYNLIRQVSESHEPVEIRGRQGAAFLVGEKDWQTINETLYLLSVPGLRESIVEGMALPLEQCTEGSPW